MPIRDLVESMAERLGGSAGVKSVYGEPVMAEGRTIVPMAKVFYGFGAGAGKSPDESGGAGGGVRAFPAGVVEISAAGTRYIPTNYARPLAIAIAGSFVAGFVFGRFRT